MVRSASPEAAPNNPDTVEEFVLALMHAVWLLLRVIFRLAKWAVLFPMLAVPVLISTWALEDGVSAPLRARAFHVTDADIDAISDRFAPPAGDDDR